MELILSKNQLNRNSWRYCCSNISKLCESFANAVFAPPFSIVLPVIILPLSLAHLLISMIDFDDKRRCPAPKPPVGFGKIQNQILTLAIWVESAGAITALLPLVRDKTRMESLLTFGEPCMDTRNSSMRMTQQSSLHTEQTTELPYSEESHQSSRRNQTLHTLSFKWAPRYDIDKTIFNTVWNLYLEIAPASELLNRHLDITIDQSNNSS